MGKHLYLTNLKPKEYEKALCVLRFLDAYYGLDDEVLTKLKDIFNEIEDLRVENAKLKKQLNQLIETWNNNFEHFNDQLEKIVTDFRLVNRSNNSKDEQIGSFVEANLDV